MITASVFRAQHGRDTHGDPVDSNGEVVHLTDDGPVGTLDVIPGWLSTRGVLGSRGEVASTQGLVGAPRDAAIKLQHGDRLVMMGTTYQISGPRLFDDDSITGEPMSHYWIQATAMKS
ncbi:hypothetical protein ACFWE3_16970 [Mycobacteriaceae bacterium NPDC060252]